MSTRRVRVGVGLFAPDQVFEVAVEELASVPLDQRGEPGGGVESVPLFSVLPLTDKLQRKHLMDPKRHRMPVTRTRADEMRIDLDVNPDEQRRRMLDLRRDVIRGWANWYDAAGNEIPFTEANREIIIAQDDVVEPVMAQAAKLASDREDAALGN